MSLRVDAVGDQIKRTTAVPVSTAFTVVGFARMMAAPAAAAEAVVFALTTNTSGVDLIYWVWDDGGGTLSEFGSYNGTTFSAANPASRPAVGTDFVFCITASGTGANLLKLQWRAIGSTTWVTITATLQTGTATQLWLGNDVATIWGNIRFAGVKVWDAALTTDELELEASILRPARFTNLHAWWPMFDATLANNLIDYSGNGKTLTSAGTLTMEDQVAVSYGAPVISHPGSAAGGTSTPQSAQATTTPTKSLTLLPGKALQATTTPTKSLVRAIAKTLQATTTPAKSLVRAFVRALQASTSPVASESGFRVRLQSAQGQSSPVASIVKQTGKPLQAITAPLAAIVKSTAKALQATTTPTKTLSALKVFLKTAQASSSPVASLSKIKTAVLALQALTAPIAALVRRTGKPLSATTSPAASMTKGALDQQGGPGQHRARGHGGQGPGQGASGHRLRRRQAAAFVPGHLRSRHLRPGLQPHRLGPWRGQDRHQGDGGPRLRPHRLHRWRGPRSSRGQRRNRPAARGHGGLMSALSLARSAWKRGDGPDIPCLNLIFEQDPRNLKDQVSLLQPAGPATVRNLWCGTDKGYFPP
jgi:hypothetical protein